MYNGALICPALLENPNTPFAVPPELLSRDAGIAVKTKICSGRQECIDAALCGDADLGLRPHAHDLGGLRWRPFVTEPVQFLMNSDNALARKEYLTIDDLKNADHVLPLDNIAIINDYIDVCLAHGFYPSFVYEASDFNLLVRNVMANNVVQITASFALTEHSSNRLVLKPLKHEGLVAEYGFVFDPDRLTLPMRSFVNAMLSYYGAEQ